MNPKLYTLNCIKINLKLNVLEPPIKNCSKCTLPLVQFKEDNSKTICYSFNGAEEREYTVKKYKICTNVYTFSNYYLNDGLYVYPATVTTNYIAIQS